MNLTTSITDGEITVTVTDIHPIALPDAATLIVNAALTLQRELARDGGDT